MKEALWRPRARRCMKGNRLSLALIGHEGRLANTVSDWPEQANQPDAAWCEGLYPFMEWM